MKWPVTYQGTSWILNLVGNHESGERFGLHGVGLTRTGQELARSIEVETVPGVRRRPQTLTTGNRDWKWPRCRNTTEPTRARTGARALAEIGDPHRSENPARLAAYAGLAPVDWQSGRSHSACLTPPQRKA